MPVARLDGVELKYEVAGAGPPLLLILLKRWMPHLEELSVPHANHALQYMNPGSVAEGLAGFLDRHPL